MVPWYLVGGWLSVQWLLVESLESQSRVDVYWKKQTKHRRSPGIFGMVNQKIVMAVAPQEFLDSLGAKSLGWSVELANTVRDAAILVIGSRIGDEDLPKQGMSIHWLKSDLLGTSTISGWWFGTWFLFFHIMGIIIPSDFHIFQRGRYTTNQICIYILYNYMLVQGPDFVAEMSNEVHKNAKSSLIFWQKDH